MYTIRIKTDAPKAMLERLKAAMAPSAIDPVVERQAFQTMAELVQNTPKRFFGQVRRDWRVEKAGPGAYRVLNMNKIMFWLEHGTGQRSGGYIYPKTAKALFVALTRRAAMSVRQTRVTGFMSSGSTTKTKRESGKNELKYGVDYVLAKRVRGIKAKGIVKAMRPLATQRLLEAMKLHITTALKG